MAHGFKERLRGGRPALGCLANMGSAVAAEIVAAAGYDCVMVDLEHGPGDVLNAVHQMQGIAAAGAVPLMRVAENHEVALKRALDAGPAGVMVPMVSTPDAARAAVAACRYPPRGVRGVAHPIARASRYGADAARYLARGEAELLLICQIETLAGVDNAAAIAATDGVDMVFIGPMDLSAAAGHLDAPDDPAVDALITRIAEAVKGAGKLLGVLATPGRPAPALFERGADLVIDAVDVMLLRAAARANVDAARRYTGGD